VSAIDLTLFIGATFVASLVALAAVAVFIATLALAWLGATQSVSADTLRLAALGLPALAIGTWLGLRLYGRLDEAAFRKIVLALLFISGVALVFR
jgi:uncharacterized protein